MGDFVLQKKLRQWGAPAVLAGLIAVCTAEAAPPGDETRELANAAYQLTVTQAEGQVLARFQDKSSGLRLADGHFLGCWTGCVQGRVAGWRDG